MNKLTKTAALLFAAVALIFTGCNQDPKKDDNPGASAVKLRQITIANGGMTGTEKYAGEIDEDNLTVTFNDVAAETDFIAIKFEINASIGAELTQATYNFLEGNDPDATVLTKDIKLVNPDLTENNEKTYAVTLNLKNPEQAPVLDKLVVKDANGAEITRTASNIIDGLLLLGVETSTAEIVSVTLKPARATYEFTTASDNVLSQANPGMLKLNFMGLTTEYQISFAASPASGADFTKAKVHAWDTNTSVYPDFADMNTRGGDMDENYILIVNRAGATANPYLLKVDDVLADNVSNKVQLSCPEEVVTGGTFNVSAGRLTQGHIYVCNLRVNGDDNLRVYHWATPTSTPEVVLDWNGAAEGLDEPYAGRLGDNISMSLDASGNGYAFCSQQEGSGLVFRFTVTNFTTFSDAKMLQMPAVANYYGMYNKVGENEYLFKSVFNPTLWLVNADATVLYPLEFDVALSGEGRFSTDFRIIEFNRSRYLLASNARRFKYYAPEAVNVWDITAGMTNAEALKNMHDNRLIDPDSEDMDDPDYLDYEPVYHYGYTTGEESVVTACVALCAAVEKNNSLLIWTAAPTAGMALIEVPAAQ